MNKFIVIVLIGVPLYCFAASSVEEGEELSGGETTIFEKGNQAFARPLANISRESQRSHIVGNSFFNKNWVISPASTSARDGLGPLFNARSCSACHTQDGRAAPPQNGELMTGLLFRLSIPGEAERGGPIPEPFYGGQLNVRAIPGMEPEGNVNISYQEITAYYDDGTPYNLRKPNYQFRASEHYPQPSSDLLMSPRIGPPVHGLGLLEAIDESVIRSWADPEDHNDDGISGRVNIVWNSEKQEKQLGRFGWKANKADLRQQTAGAFLGDIGITSSIHPNESLTSGQMEYTEHLYKSESPEIADKLLGKVVVYLQTLAPPARRDWRDPQVLRGKELFTQANCTACHIPVVKTGIHAQVPELSEQIIRPYTDLLLHDMGEGLSDGRPDFAASGREWRTPPLWGIGLTEVVNGHTYFLHDGRARNLEEAILWHGGEAESSKNAVLKMDKAEREALLAFLKSL